ncbi:MAG: cytochrome P450 [Acidimicrobiales bacterium]
MGSCVDEVQDVAVVDAEGSDPFEDFNRAMGAAGDATPYPALADLRASGPVHVGMPDLGLVEQDPDHPMFTAYTYDTVRTVLGDPETYSSADYAAIMGAVLGRTILEMDPPDHAAYRSILQQAFTKVAMQRWETELVGPLVNRTIDGFVDDGRTDLVRNLLFGFPVHVIAELLGLPEEDLPEFHRLAVQVIGVTVDMDRAIVASGALREMLTPILAERRAAPREDMISLLATAEQDGQRLTDEEIFSFCRLLLPAGAETTYRSSSNLLYGLLTQPEQLDAVRADRSLLAAAIEEGIRWEPPLLVITRGVTRDVELAGTTIPKGATVVCNLGSANRDESRWPDSSTFDVFRERKPHIGFAHGAHMCLGMHLARMETHVALNALFDRLPDLRLDPDAPDPYISGHLFRAPPRLDVVWG